MGNAPIGMREAMDWTVSVAATIVTVAMTVLTPSVALTVPVVLGIVVLRPLWLAHINGARHRWWALGAGPAVGAMSGVGIAAALPDSLGTQWAVVIVALAGSFIATMAYAAITHAPVRRASRV